MKYRNCILHSSLRSNALDRLDDNLLSFFASGEASLIHGVVDIRHGSRFSFIFERVHQLFLGLFSRKTRDLLKLLLRFLVESFNLLRLMLNSFLLIFNLLLSLIQFVLCTLHFPLLLVELLFALLLALFLLVEFLLSLTHLIFVFEFQCNEFLFCLNDFVLFNHFRLILRFSEHTFAMESKSEEANKCSHQHRSQSYK